MIPKTPGERIAAAQHALETKQYRLARLYMRLASEELEERRIERMPPLERVFHDFTEGVSALAEAVEKTYSETIIPAFQRLSEGLKPIAQMFQESIQEHGTETR